jgi:hypothetical protein
VTTDTSIAQKLPGRLRPGVGRLIAITLVGPLIGAATYAGVALLWQLRDLSVTDAIEVGGLMLGLGWMFGIIPAAVSALLAGLLGLARERRRRWLEAIAVGALSAIVALPAILPLLFGIAIPPVEIMLLFGLCGAVAFCATALPGLRAD